MDKTDAVLIFLILAIFGGSTYGSYTLGRRLERQALTKALIEEMSKLEDIYLQGYSDGSTTGCVK